MKMESIFLGASFCFALLEASSVAVCVRVCVCIYLFLLAVAEFQLLDGSGPITGSASIPDLLFFCFFLFLGFSASAAHRKCA